VSYEAHFDRFRNYIRDSWKEEPENRTGTLFNLGSHLVDQALLLFGMPEAVFADIRKQRTNAMVDDCFDLNLFYPGIKVVLKGSYLVKEAGFRFALHGTEGSFVKFGTDPQEADLQSGKSPADSDWGVDKEECWGILNTEINGLHFRGRVETIPGCFQEFYNNIYEILTTKQEALVKPEESLNGIRIIKAAYESSLKKCTVKLKYH